MILVIDYGLGNLLSVAKALREVSKGMEVRVTRAPSDLEEASHIVLPGVGNFMTGMQNLETLGMIDPLRKEVLHRRKPFMGICLGMQLMAEIGEEYGKHKGLGWIPGRVRLLDAGDMVLPHIGWHDIEIARDCLLFSEDTRYKDYYFVHSYIFDCPEAFIAAYCTYGERFAAAVWKENIYGVQFHPEKSREAGLSILRNFVWGKGCSKSAWFLFSF